MNFVDSRREIILALLKTRGHATLGEVAAHLEVSKQAALKHLETLETEGLTAVAHAQSHGGGGLAIRHCNCPIQDVAVRTPLPCKNEKEMYERLLGAPVERSTWVREAASDCTYQVKEGSKQVG